MIVHQKEEQNLYEQSDPFTTFMLPLSSLKPSNNQESFCHCVDLDPNIYDTVQETTTITPEYVTPEPQKHL